jgi:serine/threonine-protein kinase RsbW
MILTENQRKKILSKVSAEEFIGRTSQFDEILRHAKGLSENRGLLVLCSPIAGVSELLKQVYDQLFYENTETIPFYFSFSKNDKSPEETAIRFLQTYLLQVVAFRRRDAELLNISPDICEIGELATPEDGYWIDRLINACETKSKLNNTDSFIKLCLSSPFRAATKKAKTYVMLDHLHEASEEILTHIKDVFHQANISYLFAGKRRFLLKTFQNTLPNVEFIGVNQLSVSDAGLLIENLAKKNKVKISQQTRDLLTIQLESKPTFIKAVIESARLKKTDLDSFEKVQKVFTDSLLGGKIGKFFDATLNRIAPNAEVQRQVIRLLFDSIGSNQIKVPIQTWKRRISVSENEFYRLIKTLHREEFIQLTSSIIEFNEKDRILKAYLIARFRQEILGEPRALIVADCLSESLKNCPKIMSDYYRRNNAIGLRKLFDYFDCQKLPEILFNYQKFKAIHKGNEITEISQTIEKDENKINLPKIVYAANSVAFYPQIAQFSEENRSAVALGFDSRDFTDENEVVWIAAEFDSKLEATKELTEFWCDRLEMIAVMCNFSRYQLWLITSEGFTKEANEILRERDVFSSNRQQIEILAKSLEANEVIKSKPNQNEYEMVLPMGEDTEIIAAHTIEEIARKHNFQPKAINQIKTALVEACINATEHSHSPDRKIYQKFAVEKDKIVITISNRGIKMPKQPIENAENIELEGRRGWGLKLIKKLMDEVQFEEVEDGTKISMTKYLVK